MYYNITKNSTFLHVLICNNFCFPSRQYKYRSWYLTGIWCNNEWNHQIVSINIVTLNEIKHVGLAKSMLLMKCLKLRLSCLRRIYWCFSTCLYVKSSEIWEKQNFDAKSPFCRFIRVWIIITILSLLSWRFFQNNQ
jgi:hypothetical protein